MVIQVVTGPQPTFDAVGIFTKHPVIDDVTLFLEKIFQWSLPVPRPNVTDAERLLARYLQVLPISIKSSILEKHRSILPTENPRRLKNYLRILDHLHSFFLRRFSDEDLSWEIIYLVELLRSEHPEAAEATFEQPTFASWLEIKAYHFDGLQEEVQQREIWKAVLEQKNRE